MADNMIGRVFNGRYRLTERIGTGGMAQVYRAEDTVLGRVVAVKVMLPQYAANPEFAERFRQEAASAANLQNPYIVNIYDWGQDDEDYYIVMEYIRGSDLKSGIKQRGALNQRKVAEIAIQVCQALGTAHNLDIVHRDIKPQNIMVQPDGNVKVMDFGIARAKNSVKTQTSSVLGTAHYISPEQAQGKDLTPATDIYSLGVVMYEAATGQLPFDGPDAVSVAMKQVNEIPAAPRTIKPDIDPDLEQIIGTAMNKDPKHRFATVKDMQQALSNYLAGRPLNIGSSAAKTSVMSGVGGAAVGAAAGAAIGAGVAGAAMAASGADKTGVMPSNMAQQAGQQKNYVQSGSGSGKKKSGQGQGTTGKKKNKKKVVIIVVLIVAAAAAIGAFFFFGMGDPVPDVVGKEFEEAKALITDSGFEVGTVDKVYSDNVASNKVISQDPTSLFKRKKGTKINLVVSKGKEQVEVPDVTGMSSSEAQSKLEAADFKVRIGEEKYSSKYDAGKVAAQDPGGGSKADKGSTVTINISKGADTVTVPNVVGKSEDGATNALESAGFVVNVTRDYSSSVDEGYVISQSPYSGNKAQKGATITIVVSKGANTVSVPSVVGMTVAQARAALQGAGFKVNVIGSSSDNDVVTSQDPTGTAKSGATVTINAKAAS